MTENKERESTELLFWSWGHDLRQKVSAIRELVYLTKRGLASPSPDFDRIGSRLDKIDQLSAAIMNIPLPFELERVSVNSLIQELVEWLSTLEFFQHVSFEVDLEPSQPVVTANSAWLRRTLEILIENAVEAISESVNKTISLITLTDGTDVSVAVRDQGKVIDREVLSEILKKPPILRPGGKGRGLYIARLTVELYGGRIEVNSSSAGTTITLWLPLEREKG